MNANESTPYEGEVLRRTALQKIEQARTLLDSARSDLCNLEGPGYCEKWEALYPHYEKLGQYATALRRMPPPTGVFHP